MYLKDQLSVNVKLPLAINFTAIPGIIRSVQVFPNTPGLTYIYIVYVKPEELEDVMLSLKKHSEVLACGKMLVRKVMQ